MTARPTHALSRGLIALAPALLLVLACGRSGQNDVPTSAPPTAPTPTPTPTPVPAPAPMPAGFDQPLPTDWWKAESPCPDGATLVGAPPPGGREVHCETAEHKRHGPQAGFHDNGALARVGRYFQGRIAGLWRTFTAEGVLREETTYLDGQANGPRRILHANGQPLLEGGLREGRPEGLHIWRDAAGEELDRFTSPCPLRLCASARDTTSQDRRCRTAAEELAHPDRP